MESEEKRAERMKEEKRIYWLDRAKKKIMSASELIMEVNEHLRHIESDKRFKLVAEIVDKEKAKQNIYDWAEKVQEEIRKETNKGNKDANSIKKSKDKK